MLIKNYFPLTGVFFATVIAIAFLAGCEQKKTEQDTKQTFPRPAIIYEIESQSANAKLRFPGRVRAVERAELSFNVPGYLADFALREGVPVRAGDIVARLDQRIFKARVTSARAEFNRAKTD